MCFMILVWYHRLRWLRRFVRESEGLDGRILMCITVYKQAIHGIFTLV